MFDEQPDGDIHGECAAEIKRLEAELAALKAKAAVPDGWKLIPLVPTGEMLNACLMGGKYENRLDLRPAIYRAMLAAAPKAEQPPVQDITYWSIQVEKRLCEKLGKPWQASGMSIETLIDELAAAQIGSTGS